MLGYLGWFQVWYNTFNFVTYNSQFMYGRIAQFADCTGLSLPSYERHLCIQQPPAQRNPDFYMWKKGSPQVTLKPDKLATRGQIIDDFDQRIIQHQPLTYLKVVAGDVLYSFSPVRGGMNPEHYPVYDQFHTYFPATKTSWPRSVPTPAAARTSSPRWPISWPATAGDFYVPGPLLAAGLALAWPAWPGSAGAPAAGCAPPACFSRIGAIAAVEPPFIIATFDWRYELPQLSLIPIAAILGATASAGGGTRTPATKPRAPDRLADTGRPASDDQSVEGSSPCGWPVPAKPAPAWR